MDKDKIINYVMSTPENSNYSVLRSLLDSEDDHLEERVGELEECCEDMQEELANKQNLLTAGAGIILENNEISVDPSIIPDTLSAGTGIEIANNFINNTVLKVNERTRLNALEDQYITKTLEQKNWGIDPAYYGLQYVITITATGAQLKTLLEDVNMLTIITTLTGNGTIFKNNMSAGDFIEYNLDNILYPDQLIVIEKNAKNPHNILYGNNKLTSASIGSSIIVIGIQNLLNSLEDDVTYNFPFKLNYTVKYNNGLITDLQTHGFAVDPQSFSGSPSPGTIRCYISK